MGLFLGCSILTVFEFGDLLWKILKFRQTKVEDISQEVRNSQQNDT